MPVEAVALLDQLAARWERATKMPVTRSDVARALMEFGMRPLIKEIERAEVSPPPRGMKLR
jgi:hypothetical protein